MKECNGNSRNRALLESNGSLVTLFEKLDLEKENIKKIKKENCISSNKRKRFCHAIEGFLKNSDKLSLLRTKLAALVKKFSIKGKTFFQRDETLSSKSKRMTNDKYDYENLKFLEIQAQRGILLEERILYSYAGTYRNFKYLPSFG